MKSVQIDAEHYRFTIPDNFLSQWGSRYYSKKEVGKAVVTWLMSAGASPAHHASVSLPSQFVICANEVFPEAALADPLADLDVWEEWRSGKRMFPYPGVYPRLAIAKSEGKTNSTTSIGVFGEILAGLFGQAVVAPFVLVRVVRRWPDFIWATKESTFAFLESKAHFYNEPMVRGDLTSIPRDFLHEPCVDVLHELNSEPHVAVWLALTIITSVRPLRVRFCLLEFHADPVRRRKGEPQIPGAVVDSLAELLILSGTKVFNENDDLLESKSGKLSHGRQLEVRAAIRSYIANSIDEFLLERLPRSYLERAKASISGKANDRLKSMKFSAIEEGKIQLSARLKSGATDSEVVRRIFDDNYCIEIRDLDLHELQEVERQWHPSLDNVSTALRNDESAISIRCSTSALTVRRVH